MNLADKLQLLRKKNLLSQEELAEKLGISRQAVSKWESGQSLPDLNKLKAISKLYNVTIDSLVNDDNEIGERNENKAAYEKSNTSYEQDLNGKIVLNINKISVDYEYKSKKTLFGLPLVHINLGRGFKKAKGIIAIGNISYGVISVGFLSFGLLSFGCFGIGFAGFGAIALGLLLATGAISVGTFSFGAISIGVFSCGALAIGKYAFGAMAIASDIAVGDNAHAHIAIGNTVQGIKTLPLNTPFEQLKDTLKQSYPDLPEWIINTVHFFSSNITKK